MRNWHLQNELDRRVTALLDKKLAIWERSNFFKLTIQTNISATWNQITTTKKHLRTTVERKKEINIAWMSYIHLELNDV